MLPQAAPEMDEYADAFFRKFLDAGLKTGVCIRPSRIIPNPKGGWKHQQVDDPVASSFAPYRLSPIAAIPRRCRLFCAA